MFRKVHNVKTKCKTRNIKKNNLPKCSVTGQCILKVTRDFAEIVNLELKRAVLDENSNRLIWQKCQLDHGVAVSKKAMSE